MTGKILTGQSAAIVPKRRRRWALMIGITMIYTLTLPALEILTPSPSQSISPVFLIAFLPLFIALPQSPFARTRWWSERGLAGFDEFERAAITAGTRRAYAIVILILAALFGWLCLATWAPEIVAPHTPRQWLALGMSLLSIVIALPVFFAELIVPMPPADDLEEKMP
jgi:hypothetical protein